MKTAILPSAHDDLAPGFGFYDRQREGLGGDFRECLFSDIESLQLSCALGTTKASQEKASESLLDHRDVGDGDEFQLPVALVVHHCPAILRHQAMFGLFNPNDVAVIEPKRIRLERPTVVNVEQRLRGHAVIVR